MPTADTVALTEQTAGQTCYWSWSTIEGGALHLLCLHPGKDSEGHWCFRAHTHQALRLSYLTTMLTHACVYMQTHTHAQGLSLSYFIKVPDGVHTQPAQHNTDPAYKRFFIIFPHTPQNAPWAHLCIGWIGFLWGQCDRQCAVITFRVLPEWFCEWKTEPEQQ